MWCASCRADVAAELSTDNRRMICARCRLELGIAAAASPRIASSPRTGDAERDARELLARWSAQNLLEGAPVSLSSTSNEFVQIESAPKKAELRFDQPQSFAPAPSAQFLSAAKPKLESTPSLPAEPIHRAESDLKPGATRKKLRQPHLAENTEPIAASPITHGDASSGEHHAAVPTNHEVNEDQHGHIHHPTTWAAIGGQLCAYGGVGLLSCGTVLVMWSYFGGPPNFLPTGCLAAAVGQMLLFLGVVTLISCGLERTVAEVSWRIDHLAEEVHHMGLALDDLERVHRHGRKKKSVPHQHHFDDGAARDAA